MRVLILDGDEASRIGTALTLRAAGYAVAELESAGPLAGAVAGFDAIIVSPEHLKGSTRGAEALQALRKQTAVPVLSLIEDTSDWTLRAAATLGGDALRLRPASRADIVAGLAEILKAKNLRVGRNGHIEKIAAAAGVAV